MERIMVMFSDLIKIHKTPAPKNDFEKGVLDGIITARHRTRTLIETIQKEEIINEPCSNCGLEHNSYTALSKCCKHLRKE
ncbi:MAG: hypothetical protein ACTSWK_01955 [Promethearchaeota archaeon]